jgi:hypothetical protein
MRCAHPLPGFERNGHAHAIVQSEGQGPGFSRPLAFVQVNVEAYKHFRG